MSFAEWSNKKKKEREEKKPSQTIPSSANLTTNNKELPSFEEWSNKKHEGARANTTNGQEGWQKYLDDQANSKQQESEERENESFWDKLGRWLGDTGATDTTLPMGNTGQIVHDVRNDTSYTKPSDDWSEEQQYEFGALYLESPEKAYAYAEKINKENAKAKEEAEINKIKDSATSNIGAGIAHTAGAIASSGLALADYLKMLVDGAAGKDPLESDGIVSPFEYSQAVQEGIATDLNERYGTLDESIPVIGGKGWGDAYGLGTSIVQSAISGYTLGPAGTLVSYFGQGAASGMQDALERGAEDWQAAIYGASLGAFEGIAEQIGIDNLFKMGSASTLKGLLKNIVKQAGAEGLEEALTTFLSTMADDFIMQDKSQLNQLAAQYMALGLSEEEAKKQAAKDIWEGLAYDALAGAISGGVHGGAQTGIQTGISNHYAEKYFGDQSQDLVNDALNSPNSNVQEIGQKYQEMLNSGKTLSGWNLNELLEVTDTDKIQNAIRQRLASLGETGDVSELAEIISKEQSGEDLSRSERAILENSQFGKDVYYEIERRKLNTIDDSNKWMENVGTRRTNTELYNKTEYVPKKAAEVLPGTTQPTASKESKYKSSESGKTTLKGEEVSILGIESIKNGEITVRLKDGKSVNASDLDFGSHTEALMYDIVGRMDATAKTANMILRTVKPSNEALARMYYNSLPLAYEYGKIGYEAGLKNVKLPLNVKNNIYTRGRIDAMIQARVNTPQTNSTQNVSNKTDSGIIYENGFTYDEASANEMQRVSMAHIEVINKMTNLEVHVFESKVENGKRVAYINGDFVSAPNGYFKDGNKIYIDFNAGNNGEGAMLYTMSHEITHYIREWNAKGFKELGDFLIEQYGKKKVNVEYLLEKQRQKIQKRYQSEGKALPSEAKLNDMAYEEMVADAMSDMLTDPKAYEKLAKLKSQNITLWEKVGEAIKAVLDKLKTALGVYKERDVAVAKEANHVRDFSSNAYEKLQDLYIKAFVEADVNYEGTIGTRDLNALAEAKNENGEPLFQYRAMEADEDTYRSMLHKWGKMTNKQIDNLFATIDNAMELIKDNLEVLDYAWEADIDDRAFSPVKPNSDKLYQVSLDFSTLCRKRILQQTVAAQLQEALNKPLTREEGIAIRDALIALQEEGRQIEVACALCYVESARMKSPEQIKRFMENKEKVIKEFFAGKSGGNIKDKIKQAEVDVREKLHKENPNGISGKDGTTKLDPRTASLKALPKKYADAIRDGKKAAKESYKPTADEQKLIDIAKSMTVSDFTSPEGLENLVKNYPGLFDAYTSYIRNATKSKGIEGDTWWRAGDSAKIGDVLIANMNKENGLRTQSWSDFQVIHILDYIASTIELATRNTKEQAYTKVPDYVELMGSTGVMINMSLIPTANFNGTLDYDSVEGIDYKRALALRDKYHATAGTICIGVDNAQIQLLLADKTIDYVIPYHKSGMSKALRKLMHLPTWSDYESYQSESNLSRSDAEKQAKKYGVKLLDASDPNYHKGTTFSEWFDKKEAQQIAKIENANPSDKAKQKKYGVMYGGYMAMQNAANNYLKLCAERGISPKFSHEKADFTVEENYWKLLIDRKMIDNVTGEIIEQQTIKPIFNQGEVMRILNDEVARYPKVKEDQDYAIRTVTEKMLSGEVKGGMSAEAIAKVMKKPVDNVTNVNILASSEGMKFSDRDSEGNELSTEQIEFFKDSKVRDAEGRLVSLYHGTPNGGFTEFKLPHYLHSLTSANGAGFYFTDERNARQYMKGLNGKSVTKKKLYNVYLNITNPLEITEYSTGAISDEVFRRIMARGNYEWGMAHTDVEKLLQFNKLDTDRLAEMVKVFNGDEILTVMKEELGYDGVRYTDRYGDVWVAWDNRQIKETTNKTPTSHPDIRYSDRDSEYLDAVNRGDMAAAQKMVDEAAKEAGYDVTTYHGTDRDFTTFNTLYYNEFGYHTGTKRAAEEIAEYKLDGKIMKLYTKLGNTIRTPDHFGKITAMHDYIYIVRGEDHKTVDREELEGKTSTFKNKFPNNEQLEKLHEMCVDWINDRDSQYTTQDIMQATQDYFKSIGVDTIEYTNDVEDRGSTSYLLMDANQVKSADPVTYDNSGKVIPLSERFKADNDDIRYSDRDNEATSNRTILANALESVAQNDLEKTKLNQYKRKIALIDSEQARLNKIKASLRKLYFTSGKRDVDRIKSLQESARMIEKRINTYDRQLLNLESTEALKAVLQREKQMAYNKAKKEGQEALRRQKEKNAATVRELMNRNTESRQKATESRNKTAAREKIKRVVSDLNKLLLNPTQDKHVPIGLQKVVAEALDTINMDSMNAGERASYYNDLILKSTNPDEVAMLTKKRDFFAYRDANFKDRITELKNAYAEFKESDDPLIRNAHNDAIADLISNTADEVGNKSLKDMSLIQLEKVYDMYKAILATVRNANKMFKEGKQETVTENSDAVKLEVRSVGGHKDRVLKITKFLKKFGWNMLKPITAMKVIGSKTFERLFNNVRAAEDTWAVDVNEAKRFFEDMAEKYGYKKWDLKKYYSFKDSAGTNISLSLEQIMSLYAYSKREQADKHLEFGGFIFDDSIEVIEKKLGIPLKYEVNDANPYRLRKEHLLDITNALTKEQKDFVDAMQTYLSDVMGAKGNEVSLAMYDIKLYKEKNYFPLKTSRYFREFDPEKNATPKIKNSGFSKKTTPQAGNPIVLSNFMDVWAGHVNDMSMYHAFVLPLEDFMRVYNYSSTLGGYDSVQQYIKNAYGSQANQYIERLMDDLNGGARTDSSADAINKGLSLFKKASVFASASVVVQQPSAIARALAYINPKYFAKATPGALNIARHKALWAEVKKYAPVAVIKEMGYFDTGVGRSTVDWIKGNQTFKDKMDDVLSKAPALADELCWVHIWEAVKRENAAKSKSKVGSEMFLMECGKRFTEIITNTQVYDSVLSRSGMMRSKDTGMKMATAFMAEPTTTVNMMVDGFIQGMRGNKKFTAATVGAVSASVILNSILVSLVYAARDDDEDETYLEKYIGSLVSELLDGFNPLTYIPFVKDIWSILQGYDVERSDMSVISKLWESIESLFNENKSGWEKALEMTGSIASLFGIPLKNIIRDAEGMYNLTDTILSGIPTTEAGIQYAIEDAFKSSIPLWDRLHESDSKTDKLYDAIMSGDQNQINRVMATYKSEQSLETALKSALRENDSRIHEAAQARLDGDILEYARIAKQIIAEGRFSQDTVVAAINAEMSAIKKAQSDPAESTDDNDEVTSIYKADDINAAFNNGDKALAISIIDELVKMKVANGMDEKKAKSSLRSSMTSYWKPLYIEAAKSGNKAEMQRIKQIMYYSGLYGSAADVVKSVKDWFK